LLTQTLRQFEWYRGLDIRLKGFFEAGFFISFDYSYPTAGAGDKPRNHKAPEKDGKYVSE
jgi:hypothetical protein